MITTLTNLFNVLAELGVGSFTKRSEKFVWSDDELQVRVVLNLVFGDL